jgi:hypothetical protein
MLLIRNQSLNYIFFYFGISRASSMVKLGICVEEKFFAVCMAIHVAVCKNLSWFASFISYLAQFQILGDHIRFK